MYITRNGWQEIPLVGTNDHLIIMYLIHFIMPSITASMDCVFPDVPGGINHVFDGFDK